MDEISMDALNRGWAIGFGTRINAQNPDFDYALSRADIRNVEAPNGRSPTERVGACLGSAEALIASLARRLVY